MFLLYIQLSFVILYIYKMRSFGTILDFENIVGNLDSGNAFFLEKRSAVFNEFQFNKIFSPSLSLLFKRLLLTLLISFFCFSSFAQYAGGAGTLQNPFQIQTWYHLKNISLNPNSNFILISHLDQNTEGYQEVAGLGSNQGNGWAPIVNFKGRFNGNGHVIADLVIQRGTQNAIGLFGSTSNSEFKHIQLRNATITGASDVGALIGVGVNVRIENCSFSGSVSGSTYVGGLIGTLGNATISDSYSLGKVSGKKSAGGLVGNSYQTSIIRSFSSGYVGAESEVGGLVGYFQSNSGLHTLKNCYSIAEINSREIAGGIVGKMSGGLVRTAYFAGTISEVENSGGLVGLSLGNTKITQAFWNETAIASAVSLTEDKGKSSLELKSGTFLENNQWDFDATWSIRKPSKEFPFISYPYLRTITYDQLGQNPPVNPIPGLENLRVPRENDFPSERMVTYGDPELKLGEEMDPSYFPILYTTSDTTVIKIEGNYARILKSGITTVFAKVEDGNSSPKEQRLIVNPAILRVKADDNWFKVYGEPDPVLSYQVEGLKYEDGLVVMEGTLSRQEGEQVGQYPVLQGSLTAGENYVLEFEGMDFRILKRELKVKANAQVKSFGTTDPLLTYQVSGIAPQDEAENLFTGELQRAEGEKVGKYLISAGSLQAGPNYSLVYTSDSLQIAPVLIISMRGFPEVITPWSIVPQLPGKGEFLTQEGTWKELDVLWNTEKVQFLKRGKYQVDGVVGDENYLIPQEFDVSMTVTVLPKPAPEDLIFRPVQAHDGLLSKLEVIDPIDSIHSIRLSEGSGYQEYFEIVEDELRTKGFSLSKTSAAIDLEVEVEDRDGNILRKKFTIEPKTVSGNSERDLEIINSFSPNGDGVNDTWMLSNGLQKKSFKVSVFDSGGKVVFQSQSMDVKWDGTFHGQVLPEGSYYWVLETDGQTKRGVLNLLRGN